ncbi:2OG-Fe(II) oxygenase [Niabella beijingensis]|uniref:2OG-Fe(II) oxygenase n=1 Tax=Niabella beijingensis TaxID=2872700 RepID=UPI001CBCB42B|nr:2OG-Fe(II) oxygenase [Niabella beijingensis]MBZ4188104.1 2OG-Fe(II) oxygenase [Niabella beijingensis]
MNFKERFATQDWSAITASLHEKGFALIRGVLTTEECTFFQASYDHSGGYRKVVIMERYRFGKGAYKYFRYPLPEPLAAIRTHLYPYLVPVANSWFKALEIDMQFPANHSELLAQCHVHQQLEPTPLILKYDAGGYNTLHQDLYGLIYFPIQAVFMLSQPGTDFTGGEFVLTQQIPRSQSRAIVLQPEQGDLLLFTTNFKPVKGTKGYYRVNMKHGVSEVRDGTRYTLGIIFHDALS